MFARHSVDGEDGIRIDLPGHGLTGEIPSGDYSFENYERLLLGTLDAIGVALADFTRR